MLSRIEVVSGHNLRFPARSRRARRVEHPAPAPGRPGPADRGGNELRGVGRRRAVRPVPAGASLRGPGSERLRRRGRHAGGGVLHPARPPQRLPASRRGQRPAARSACRADHGAHQRRRDPRPVRLRRRAGCPKSMLDRQPERGFRLREFARGHLSARQHVLPHYAGRAQHRARCMSRTPAVQPPTIPFWFGEAPGPQRRIVSRPCHGLREPSFQRADRATVQVPTRPARGSTVTTALAPSAADAIERLPGCRGRGWRSDGLPTQQTHRVGALLR